MTKTTRIEVNSVKEAVEFFGKMHMEYMEMLMTNSGHFHKTENWSIKDGKGFAEVIITID
jgi:hypothetical protein